MKKNILLILVVSFIVLLSVRKGNTQSYYLEGKEWWFTDAGVLGGGLTTYFISDYATQVTIEYPLGSGTDTTIYTVSGVMTTLPVDPSYNHNLLSRNQIRDYGIRVTSCKPGFMFYARDGFANSTATYLIPLDKLDKHYVVTGLKENHFTNDGNPFDQPTEFVIVATEDNTNITFVGRDTSAGSFPATIPDTLRFILNRGQTYRCTRSMNYSIGDFVGVTGSEVISDKPIAVFASGHPSVCGNEDDVSEQTPPYKLWGKRYITAQSIPRGIPICTSGSSADYIEILAGPNPTTVTVQGATTTIYNLKPFHSTRHIVPSGSLSCSPLLYFDNGEANTIITADYPVMIHQIMQSSNAANNFQGDPSVITVFPEST